MWVNGGRGGGCSAGRICIHNHLDWFLAKVSAGASKNKKSWCGRSQWLLLFPLFFSNVSVVPSVNRIPSGHVYISANWRFFFFLCFLFSSISNILFTAIHPAVFFSTLACPVCSTFLWVLCSAVQYIAVQCSACLCVRPETEGEWWRPGLSCLTLNAAFSILFSALLISGRHSLPSPAKEPHVFGQSGGVVHDCMALCNSAVVWLSV